MASPSQPFTGFGSAFLRVSVPPPLATPFSVVVAPNSGGDVRNESSTPLASTGSAALAPGARPAEVYAPASALQTMGLEAYLRAFPERSRTPEPVDRPRECPPAPRRKAGLRRPCAHLRPRAVVQPFPI